MSGGFAAWREGHGLGARVYAQFEPEDDLADDLEEEVEEDVEADIEDSIEDDVEADIEDDIESQIEDDVEADIENDVEDDIEGDIEDAIESEIEDDVEDDVEDDLEDDLEDEVEDDIEDDVEDDLEDELEDDIDDDDVEDDADGEDDDRDDDDDNERDGDDRADGDADLFAIDFDPDSQEIRAGETLILVRPEVADILDRRGYQSIEVRELSGLNYVLARVRIPTGFDLGAEAAAVAAADPQGQVDYNHIYRPQDGVTGAVGTVAPGVAYARRASFGASPEDASSVRIGLIDTHIDLDHGALRGQAISIEDFAEGDGARPDDHGTSVASILVGGGDEYAGLIPGAKLYAASVFHIHDTGGTIASAASLVRALDWLVLNKAPVVNMSLAGPPNDVLRAAIDAAAEKGVIVVAAAGNKGPVAKPLYPAAYDPVIAVTAVNERNSVYRLAGRGEHIDFAAPGVEIVTATAKGGYAPESGTSMAAPFATVAVALHCAETNDCTSRAKVMDALIKEAVDLGPKGFDTTYGHGLIRP